MPLYDYRCRSCDEVFEAVAPVRECKEDRTHEGCGGSGKRILSVVAFDWHKMGCDPDFATFGAKWERDQKNRLNRAKQRDEG